MWPWLVGRIIQPFLPYILGGLLVLSIVGTLGGYIKGYGDAASKCQNAQLQAKIDSMQRDVDANKVADDINKMLQDSLEKENADLQQKVQDYAVYLALHPDTKCTLSDDDVVRMRGLGRK